jgi:hypothetical protein
MRMEPWYDLKWKWTPANLELLARLAWSSSRCECDWQGDNINFSSILFVRGELGIYVLIVSRSTCVKNEETQKLTQYDVYGRLYPFDRWDIATLAAAREYP